MERVLYPDSSEENLTFDCIGNVTQKVTGSKNITYHYNASSQLIQVEYPDSSIYFTYDANGNRTSMLDPNSMTLYEYDSRNRLTLETKIIDGTEYTISYSYDAASHLISTTCPDNTTVEQNYDNLGRLTSINGYADYLWSDSQLQQITYANGVTTDYNYDVRGRPTQIHTQKNDNDLLNLTYTCDAVGNVLQMKNTENVGGQQIIKEQWGYTYDSLNRLKTATGGPPGQNYLLNYQYDSTGNRTQLNNTLYAYSEMNELISAGSEGNTLTFTYDEYGNCIEKSDGTRTFEYMYDSENRPMTVKVDGIVTEEYLYDGDGNRIKKTDSSSERVYIYGGLNVLYEVNVRTHMNAVYIYGIAGRIAKKVNDMKECYHTDHLGSTRLVTSENGVVAEEIRYEPFGEQINTSEERYTYNGKERDETGLYYYGARYYDPHIGRFMTRDVVKGDYNIPQSLNRYMYCRNNPLLYTDPDGRMEKKFTMDVSRSYSGYLYSNQIWIGPVPEATLLTVVQSTKGNSEVSVSANLHTNIPYGPGGTENTKATAMTINVVNPEGSIVIGSVDFQYLDLTKGGLAYIIQNSDNSSAFVGFDYNAVLSEENSGVTFMITFSLDPAMTLGEDVMIVFTVTITGGYKLIATQTVTIPADDNNDNASIC